MSTKLYFDNRRPDQKGRGSLRVVISKRRTTAMFSTGIKLMAEQWDGNCVVKHPEAKRMNTMIKIMVGNIERTLIDLTNEGRLMGKTAAEVVTILQEELDPVKAQQRKEAQEQLNCEANGVAAYFQKCIDSKTNPGTRQLYIDTYRKIETYCMALHLDFDRLTFDEIHRSFLESFQQFCLKTQKQNTASRHLRDFRAVFNLAIDDGITSNYPFRKFTIAEEDTRDKSFPVEKIRELFNHNCFSACEQEAVDMFKLMFCLIGINPVDLAYLREEKNGRVEYIRKKTHKIISVKIEPEAREIIEKYKGKDYLINILERFPNYKTYFNRMAKTLRKVGLTREPGKKNTGKPILPGVCCGSARTSWSTIGEGDDIVSHTDVDAGLGHSMKNDITAKHYSRIDRRKKVDVANRKILDWVFYGKRRI